MNLPCGSRVSYWRQVWRRPLRNLDSVWCEKTECNCVGVWHTDTTARWPLRELRPSPSCFKDQYVVQNFWYQGLSWVYIILSCLHGISFLLRGANLPTGGFLTLQKGLLDLQGAVSISPVEPSNIQAIRCTNSRSRCNTSPWFCNCMSR